MARPKGKDNELEFEKSLKKLEEIVHKLEEEEISLEASLKYYAEGQSLVKACERKLADAENRIKALTENAAGEIGEEDFDAECDEEETQAENTSGTESTPPSFGSKDEIPF